MTAKEQVKRNFPRAKCIRALNVYMVLAWDAFFAVGPLLGCGYSVESGWEDAKKAAA
jgi:hypothetical protein